MPSLVSDPHEDLRPVREAAEHARVTPSTVRRWIHEGRFRGYRTPGEWRVNWPEFTEWLRGYEEGGGPPEKVT